MDEELQHIINTIAADTQEHFRERALTAWIESRVASAQLHVRADLIYIRSLPNRDMQEEVERWNQEHGALIAQQTGEVLRVLLRRELLGE